jgi:hypothetical protein
MITSETAPPPIENRGAPASMIELQSDAFASPELEGNNEFSYRPIPVLAPVSLIIGLISVIGLASVAGLAVPLAGVILGVLGLRQISQAHGEYGGYKLTISGLVLSTLCLIAGSSLHAYTYATEVPEGYERLSFRWLAEQKPIVEDGQTRIHPEAKSLDGQKVFIKGYMYPENAKSNLKRFVLCKDTGQCCFGGKPSLTDMIVVEFVNDVRANFRELSLVNVAGTFRAKKVIVGGELTALYQLEAEYFK